MSFQFYNNWPYDYSVFPTMIAHSDLIGHVFFTGLNQELQNIENTLGLNIAGIYATVVARLNASDSKLTTAYDERKRWDGGSTDLVAATGRTSLGLGSLAVLNSISNSQLDSDAASLSKVSGGDMVDSGNKIGVGGTPTAEKFEVTGNVKISGIIIQDDWVAPTLLNSWVNYGSGSNPAGYFKDKQGIVHLRGLVANGVGTTIFTLPVGFRPTYVEFKSTVASAGGAGTFAVYVIYANGNIDWSSGGTTWFSLDEMTFKAA